MGTSARRPWFSWLVPMALLAGGPATAIAQTSVADAPWSGEAACVMVTRGPDYAEQQGHRWRLTGERPVVKGSVRFWPAVWSVQGGGSKGEDHWTINVPETPAPIAMYETPGPGGNNGLRIESQHAQLTARQAIRLAVRPAVTRSQYEFTLWELAFPRIIVGSAAQVTVVSDSITRAGAATYAWQAPSGAQSTETCTFRFERGSAPQSTQLAATVTPIAQPTLSAAGVSKPQIQQVETTTTASTPASIARVETGTIPTLSRTAPASSTPTTSPGSNTNPPPPPPPVAPAADIAVTLTTTPGESWAEIDHNKWITGGTMWLTVSVSNAGPASADGTIVTVPPAVGFLKQSVGCSLGACPTAAELEAGWMIGWLPSGATVRFFIEHRLSVTSGQVTLLATATLPAGIIDPNPANGRSGRQLQVLPNTMDVQVAMPAPSLTNVQTSGPTTQGRFRVVVTNTGPLSLKGTLLTVPPVTGLQKIGVSCFSQGCPSSVTVAAIESGVALEDLPTGRSMTFEIVALATTAGSVTMTASATPPAWLNDSVPGDNSASATAMVSGSVQPADLRLNMADTSRTSDRIAYTVNVRNLGPGRADGAMLVVPPVPGLVKTSVSCQLCPSQPSISAIESGLLLPGLPSGGSASSLTYHITSMAIAPGPVNVTAQVMAPPNVTDPVSSNNSASLSATMSPPPAGPATADLDVTVTVAEQRIVGPLNNGFVDVTYDVLVWNHGPGAAHGAIVKVPAIAGISRTEVRCIPDSASSMSCATDIVSPAEIEAGLVLPWLASGRRVTIKITSNVPPSVASFVATASVAAPAGVTEASDGNNSAQVNIMVDR